MMRGTAWIGAMAVMAIAAPAAAQGVKVARGEEAAFTLEGGASARETRAPATATPFEAAIGREFSGMTPPDAPVAEGVPIQNDGSRPAAPVPEPGKLRFRFMQVPGTVHSLLIVHNGYSRALLYRARIMVGGKAAPTDVCLVMPGKTGVEHWPYAIDAIEVSGFEQVAWKPGDDIPCK